MAFGFAEDPARSIGPHLEAADYPITREELVLLAEDDGAPASIINVLKVLPRTSYASAEEVRRDLAEAARRFAAGPGADREHLRDRRNIGRRPEER